MNARATGKRVEGSQTTSRSRKTYLKGFKERLEKKKTGLGKKRERTEKKKLVKAKIKICLQQKESRL